ncbi:MAG: phosphoenolpyruvate--protein phosphotransferase [Deltaproteobacteria bacterium HGW-Deltaproteobacteria-1]|jgi:phosphoenolpyruvate-protein phosphotransferase|nr:MAG: phosphoenolpyruvate--protein phosphotransferase [Deltaproteobacteria bacterium HGW-Deltaproteobacteria-1]
MQPILGFIEKMNTKTATRCIIFLSLAVLGIDLIMGKEVQFPLIYVLPVGIAAWRNQKNLAYAMSIVLPVVRGVYEFPWHTSASLSMASINTLMEIAALMLYSHLVDKTAIQTRRLQKTVTTREKEISRLRAFTRNTSTTLQGRGISPGMAEGVALIYLPLESELTSVHQAIAPDDVETEINRLDCALAAAIRELENTQKQFAEDMATAESELLDVHLAMLKDVGFWDKCRQRVREDLVKVEQAVAEEVQELVAMMEGLKQDFMLERSADIRDMGRRVLRNIGAFGEISPNQLVSLPPNTILVAKELLTSDMLQLDHTNLAALVTECNGPASHVAILARIRNIPAVSDIKDVTSLLETGDHLLVDAEANTVTIAPTNAQVARFFTRRSQYPSIEPTATPGPTQESATKDGVRIGLYANIGRTDEANLVLEYKLDGVGLFRSEFLFLDVDQPPDLDAQFAAYSAVAKMLAPQPVVIRTMDLGDDKIPRFKRTENDLAFKMGKRGLAFSLTEKTMFRTQLRAILRAAQGADVRIMFPMVMSAADLRKACHLVDELIETDQLAKRPPIGTMIETPAAVFDIHEIVKIADFVSIGTNDLAHFILAADRKSQGSSGALSFMHPSVLRATDHVIRAALEQGVSLTVCGEAAGNPAGACLLVGMGVRNLSMNPFQATRIRHVLQELTLEQTETAARDALGVMTPEDVQQIAAFILRGKEM